MGALDALWALLSYGFVGVGDGPVIELIEREGLGGRHVEL